MQVANPNHSTRLSGRFFGIAALVAAVSLVACGGSGDDGAQPEPRAIDLSDCFNPSMYTPGSSWTVRKKSVERVIDTGAVTVPMNEADFETQVTKASSGMGLGEGVVSWSDGNFFRVADGKVAELMTRTTGRLAVSWKYDPPILQPTSLPVGAVYTSPQSTVYFNSVYGGPDTVVNVGTRSHSLTFVAAETVTVAAGTFATCHVQLQQTSKSDVGQNYIVKDSWWVAGGPFKGIEVKAEEVSGGVRESTEVTAIRADWK